MLFAAGFPTPPEAGADHNTCRLKAVNYDVYVRVFDVDRSGNTIWERNLYGNKYLGGELWKGELKKGESKIIESYNGKFRYDYKSHTQSRTYGNNLASCVHSEIIRLP
jgi:hypothetical protein